MNNRLLDETDSEHYFNATRRLSAQLAAAKAVLADRDRELLRLKGPCRTEGCRSHYAHSGPCNIEEGFVSDVPPGEVGSEWTMAYKVDGEEKEPGYGGQVFGSREEAKRHIEAWQRLQPSRSYTDVRYLRRTVLTGPWVTP